MGIVTAMKNVISDAIKFSGSPEHITEIVDKQCRKILFGVITNNKLEMNQK